jgi:fatty-acyl-CoA synthase
VCQWGKQLASGILAADWIAHYARHTPASEAAHDLSSGRHFTYAQLDDRATNAALWLKNVFRIARNDRVAVLSRNDTDVFELQFACHRLGAIFVPLNWRLAVSELSFICRNAAPKVLLYGAEFSDMARELSPACVPDAAGLANGLPSEYESGLANAKGSVDAAALDLDDTWMIMYTSGTSGRPKGVLITYRMCVFNALHCAMMVGLTARSKNLVVLPTFHTGGLNIYANPTFHIGGTNIVMRNFDPVDFLSVLTDKKLGLTHLMGVPTNFAMLAQVPGFANADLSHIQCIGIGGAAVPVTLIAAYGAKGIKLRQGWGMTETGPVALLLSGDMALKKAGSSGLPPLYVQLKICDSEGKEVKRGETGELLVRGPNVTPGYWNLPDADVFTADGWLRSGDAARQDEDGYYFIVDRLKDMFISGGENVYPAEIENVISHLIGVLENAVISIPDDKWGEVGRAFVVLQPGNDLDEATILGHCGNYLARFKVPKEVRFLKALPRNAAGKIVKHDLDRDE